ncbi:hypothetical protein D5R95_01775, partial [Methanosalsum natronophilum]
VIQGYVTDFDDDMILLTDENVISGVSLNSVHSWQVYINKEQDDISCKNTITNNEQIEQNIGFHLLEPFIHIYKKLNEFNDSKDSVLFRMVPKEAISKVPDFLKNSDDNASRSIWDSVLAKLNKPSGTKNGDIEELSDQFIKLLNKYPSQSILEYNLGYLKLKASNYPSAAKHFDNAYILSSKRESLYNSIYAHLQAGNKKMITLNLAKYLYGEPNIVENKFWSEFSCLCKERQEFSLFASVADSTLNVIEDTENINWLFASIIFVFENIPELAAKVQAMCEDMKSNVNDIDHARELIQSFLTDVQLMEIGFDNKDFKKWVFGDETEVLVVSNESEHE